MATNYTETENVSNFENDTILETYPDPFNHMTVRVTFIILYSIVFAACIIGNSLVIIVILRHRRMRTITNFFLANLAVADLCVGVFCLLPNLSQYLSPYWLLGKAMCKLSYSVQAMSYTASITILTAISIERYVAIIHPMRSKRLLNVWMLRGTVIGVWTVSIASGVPYLIFYDTVSIHTGNTTMVFCIITHTFNDRAYSTITFIMWYVLPLALITVMYTRISLVLWRTSRLNSSRCVGTSTTAASTKTKREQRPKGKPLHKLAMYQRFSGQSSGRPNTTETGSSEDTEDEQIQLCRTNGEGSVNGNGVGGRTTSARDKSRHTNGINGAPRQSNGSHRKSAPSSPPIQLAASVFRWAGQRLKRQATDNALMARRRVIRLLMAVVVSFAVCVAPYHIRMLWQTWSHPNMTFGTLLVPPITFVLYYLNSAVNPMLYAFLSVNFRKSLIEVVTCANQNRTRSRNGPFSASGRTVHTAV